MIWDQRTARQVVQLIAVAIVVTIVMAALVLFLKKMNLIADDLRRDVDSVTANVNTLLVTLNATAGEARAASEQAKLAAAEQRAYWNKTSLETYKTMASLRLTIVRTDHSVNDVLMPRVALTLDNTNRLSSTAADQLARTMDDLRPVLTNLGHASAAAAAAMEAAGNDMQDPAIRETLAHLDETSAEAARTAASAAETVAHVDATAADIQAFVHRETTPVRGTWNVIKTFLRDFAGPAAQVATSAK